MRSSNFEPRDNMFLHGGAITANGPTVPSDIPPMDPDPTHKPGPIGPTPTPEPLPEPVRDPDPGSPQPDNPPPPIVDPTVPTAPQPIIT